MILIASEYLNEVQSFKLDCTVEGADTIYSTNKSWWTQDHLFNKYLSTILLTILVPLYC